MRHSHIMSHGEVVRSPIYGNCQFDVNFQAFCLWFEGFSRHCVLIPREWRISSRTWGKKTKRWRSTVIIVRRYRSNEILYWPFSIRFAMKIFDSASEPPYSIQIANKGRFMKAKKISRLVSVHCIPYYMQIPPRIFTNQDCWLTEFSNPSVKNYSTPSP